MVYIDSYNAKFGRMTMCHMVADTFEELHQMADEIGIARRWFQGDHYDICLSKKAIALKLGAKEVDGRELMRVWKKLKGQRQ